MKSPLSKRVLAELIGTFWLVFGGCGAAIFSAAFPSLGIGFLGVSLAFGLTVLTIAFALGPISGAHLNPAVSLGLVIAGRFPKGELISYALAQISGSVLAAMALYAIASGNTGFELADGFAANGYGLHSPGGFSAASCFVAEAVLTFMFLMIILGATDKRATTSMAPIAIGLGLTLVHLIGIPITNTSVNPARSTSQALFVGGWAMSQLWMFWIAPLLGSSLAGVFYSVVFREKSIGQAYADTTGGALDRSFRDEKLTPPTRLTRL